MNTPYLFWSKSELLEHLLRQADYYGYKSTTLLHLMVYDDRWNPITDYNGCTFVQDKHHPFLPCFIHDYRWIVDGGGYKYDKEFRDNLRKCRFSWFRANAYFIAVRLAWFFYYKWTK